MRGTDASTDADVSGGHAPGRYAETLIFSAFLLLCAAGVLTVLLPEGSGEQAQGAPSPTSAPATDPSAAPPAN